MKKFKVNRSGEIQFLEHADENILNIPKENVAFVKVERVSHVEPREDILRFFFVLIRKFVPKLTAWTRTWKCYWQVRFVDRPKDVYGPFATRERAIKFETQYLDNRNL